MVFNNSNNVSSQKKQKVHYVHTHTSPERLARTYWDCCMNAIPPPPLPSSSSSSSSSPKTTTSTITKTNHLHHYHITERKWSNEYGDDCEDDGGGISDKYIHYIEYIKY